MPRPIRAVLLLGGLTGVTAGCGGTQVEPTAALHPTSTDLPASAVVPTRRPSSVSIPPTASAPLTVPPAACTNKAVIAGWSLDQRARRLVVAPSYDFDVVQLAQVIRSGVGGVLFLGTASPPSDLAGLIQRAVGRPSGGVPPLTMADEEGGGVQRLEGAVAAFPWPRQLAATYSPPQVRDLAHSVAEQMRAAGVDVDLAPVLDVDATPGPSATNPDGERSFSGVSSVAASYGSAFMRGLVSGGVKAVLKHFPGLGGSRGNSDVGPANTRTLTDLEASDLLPFASAVVAGASAVMVANDAVPGLTTSPASVSAAVIGGLLRSRLGFDGVVLTDSLSAGSIAASGYSVTAAAVASVEAGADLVLFGSTLDADQTALLAPGAVALQVDAIASGIVDAVGTKRLLVTQLDDAVGRVVAWEGASLCPAPTSSGAQGQSP